MKKRTKRKIHIRILAILLCFSFLLNDAAIISLAADSEEKRTFNAEETYEEILEEFNSYEEELNKLYDGVDFKDTESDNMYTSQVLLVQLKGGMNTAIPSTNPRYVMELGDGLFAVSYSDSDSTKKAEQILKGSSEIDYVEPDYILKTCDLKAESGQEEKPDLKNQETENIIEEDPEQILPEESNYIQESLEIQEEQQTEQDQENSLEETVTQIDQDFSGTENIQDVPEGKIRVVLLDDVSTNEQGDFHGNHVQEIFRNAFLQNGGNVEDLEFISLSVFDKDGYGTVLRTHLAAQIAKKMNADILICPFAGNGKSELFTRSFNTLAQEDMFVIAAIGNDGEEVDAVLPAENENVIGIGSVSAGKERCQYSNYGKNLDFVCYGKYKTTDGATFRGTSAACAYFGGYAASIKEKNRELTSVTLLENLKNEAEDLGLPGKDKDFGYGLIGGIPDDAIDEMEDAPISRQEDNDSKKAAAEEEKKEFQAYAVGSASPLQIYQYGNGYVGIELHGSSEYPSMKIGVWCIENGQDDLCWYNMTKRSDGVWIYTIPLSNHGQEGVYAVHAYVGGTCVATGDFQVSGASGTGAFIGETGSPDTLYAYGFNIRQGSNSISRVQLAVWTEEYGQDDLCWYDGSQAWGDSNGVTYAASFDIKQHKRLPSGLYNVYVYVTDSAGITKCVAAWQGVATCTSSYNSNQSKTGYHVEQIGTENCHHEATNCAVVYCIGDQLNPSVSYLRANRRVENQTGHPFNVTYWMGTDPGNWGIGDESISHTVLHCRVQGGDFTVAAPYGCPDGYAGYAYFYNYFSYCDKYDEWAYVASAHYWLGCVKGDVGENERHDYPMDHPVGVYALKPNTYTICFDGNGATSGSMGNLSMTYDKPADLPTNTFKRNGYKFVGWSTSPSGGVQYGNGQTVNNLTSQNGGVVTLYAQWEKSKPPTVVRVKNVQNRKDGFWTFACVKDNGDGISRVVFPVWSRKNGQDDLFQDWYTNAGGIQGKWEIDGETYNYCYYNQAALHNNEYGLHDVHVYAIDNYEGFSYSTSTFLYEYQLSYIGNGQDVGSDFTEYRRNIELSQTFFDNGGVKRKGQHFLKDAKVSFRDSVTGEEIFEDTTETVVGWSLENNNDQTSMYPTGDTGSSEKLFEEALRKGKITEGHPAGEYESFPEKGNKYGIDPAAYAPGSDIFVNLYAVWDRGAVIEAYDLYYTLADAQSGFITENNLLSYAAAYDEELKTNENPQGKMSYGVNETANTSFTVSDYSAGDFTTFTKSGKVSITYEAVDAAGNHTKKMVDVHIVDADGKNLLKAKGKVRFISSKYRDTLKEDSVWNTDEEYQEILDNALSYRRQNPEKSEPLPIIGEAYQQEIAGTGTWNKTPKTEWKFTKEQIAEVKEYLDNYGPSNYQTENGLDQFTVNFGACKVK